MVIMLTIKCKTCTLKVVMQNFFLIFCKGKMDNYIVQVLRSEDLELVSSYFRDLKLENFVF